ncbi:MAG: hypothetical protein EBT07_10280 [Actinobacteria bacterium]|nr:hypothetical protein [Actinomycetota bacterium]
MVVTSRQKLKTRFDVWYCYKSGLGIEVARVAPLLGSLVQRYTVSFESFHASLYHPLKLIPKQISETNLTPPPSHPGHGDGIAFVCDKRIRGPFCDTKREKEAKKRGYLIVREDLGFPKIPLYEAAKRLAWKVCGKCKEVDFNILTPGVAHGTLILNLFGGSSLVKGLRTQQQVERLLKALHKLGDGLQFLVPVLPHQKGLVPANLPPRCPVRFVACGYLDPQLTVKVAGSPLIITVEGGMLHLAAAYRKPTICLLEKHWFDKVRDLLPPLASFRPVIVPFDSTDFFPLVDALASVLKKNKRNLQELGNQAIA